MVTEVIEIKRETSGGGFGADGKRFGHFCTASFAFDLMTFRDLAHYYINIINIKIKLIHKMWELISHAESHTLSLTL